MSAFLSFTDSKIIECVLEDIDPILPNLHLSPWKTVPWLDSPKARQSYTWRCRSQVPHSMLASRNQPDTSLKLLPGPQRPCTWRHKSQVPCSTSASHNQPGTSQPRLPRFGEYSQSVVRNCFQEIGFRRNALGTPWKTRNLLNHCIDAYGYFSLRPCIWLLLVWLLLTCYKF